MNPFLAVVAGLAGGALIVLAVLFRLGRQPWARDWVHDQEESISRVMMLLPGGGAGLVAFGVVSWADENVLAGLVLALTLPTFFVLSVCGGLQLRVPLWFLPRWSRDSIRGRRAAVKKR